MARRLRVTPITAAILALWAMPSAPAAQDHGPKGSGRFEHVHALAVDVEGQRNPDCF
jgi:hypothetical protein